MCSRVFITETIDGFLQAVPYLRPSQKAKIKLLGDRLPTDPVMVFTVLPPYFPEWDLMECSWGFLHPRETNRKHQADYINARAESLLEKPTWRDAALHSSSHCLVPISGFYEWPDGVRHRILPKDGNGFLLAGLTSRWVHSGETLDTFTVITTEPSEEFKPYHVRMPAILDLRSGHKWLTEKDPEVALKLLRPAPSGTIRVEESPTKPVQEKLDLGI